MADEVAEVPVRDLGDERAARAAQQAATGRPCEITGLGRSVVIHLVRCPQSPDAEAVPGQLKATLDGTVAFRVRAAFNSFILLDSDRAALLPPHPGLSLWAKDQLEEFQAIDCALDESRGQPVARWGHGPPAATTGHVTPWWQSTSTQDQVEIERGRSAASPLAWAPSTPPCQRVRVGSLPSAGRTPELGGCGQVRGGPGDSPDGGIVWP